MQDVTVKLDEDFNSKPFCCSHRGVSQILQSDGGQNSSAISRQQAENTALVRFRDLHISSIACDSALPLPKITDTDVV